MYKAFYQFKRNPFELSPDPSFLYPTKRHFEALASLYYGIRARKGFVVLTGEVGTGKTMVVRCLLQKLDKNQMQYAYVFNTRLSPREFLRYLAGDLGMPKVPRDKAELLLRLNEHLIRRHSAGHTTVVIVDEAHLLRENVLEEIRLLTNLEGERGKLLQIALVGQPELDQRLDSPQLRQLKQRIALRYQLQPLYWEEVEGYVNWRLRVAGAETNDIFPPETLEAVYRYSRGYPRLINTICENSLINGFAASTPTISVEQINEVCRDLRLSEEPQEVQAVQGNGGRTGNAVNGPELARALEELVDVVQTATHTYQNKKED